MSEVKVTLCWQRGGRVNVGLLVCVCIHVYLCVYTFSRVCMLDMCAHARVRVHARYRHVPVCVHIVYIYQSV